MSGGESNGVITPRLKVWLSDGSEPYTVQVYNPDLIRWDRTAAKHSWPKFDAVPAMWQTFLAWSASRRDKRIGSDVTWETFSDELCLQVYMVDAAGNRVGEDELELESVSEAHPTQRAAEPD